MRIVDLRSDTVTKPTPAMRRAMAEAEVGDDVYGEDPTVNRLEALAAEMMGKEAGMFVASGTMGNLSCVLTHCGRGDEMILGDQAHIFNMEQGGAATLGGIQPRTLPNRPAGALDLNQVEEAIRPDNPHYPRSRLLCLENTHNRCSGAVLPVEYVREAALLARRHGLRLHMDGARIFNAAVALGVSAAELVGDADSVTFCLSKGLAAPVGSVVCGSQDFITQARRQRKVLGGSMRQVGVIAAAGIVALTEMVERLVDDHVHAWRLAEGLAELPGIELDLDHVQTNIVIFDLIATNGLTPQTFSQQLAWRGVRINPIGGRRLRAVTHYHIGREDIEYTLEQCKAVLAS